MGPSLRILPRFKLKLLGTSKTFSAPPPGNSSYNQDFLLKAIPRRLSDEQKLKLASEVTSEEIREVFFSLKANKAPGPDGFHAYFFKKAWCIVGDLVLRAVKSFFVSGRLLKEVNSTAISLIPKVPNPTQLKDFRPISCCNTIYKCIAKIWPIG